MKHKEKIDALNNKDSIENQIISAVREGRPLLGKQGVMTPLLKKALEAALEGELDGHLEEKLPDNRRNGKLSKKLRSDIGPFEINVPGDRDGSFSPQIVKKRRTILCESLDLRILSLFQGGMSYSDIGHHIDEMYDFSISPGTISKITDRLIPVIHEWRERPLSSVYSVIFLDAMFFKSRIEGRVETRCVYNLLGIDLEGKKEVLGFYTGETEGARFWLQVLTDLKNRGVKDILIACIDGLKGFPEAIQTIYPKTEVQLCIVHQIRHSLKYISHKDKKQFLSDLKQVYKASTKKQAEENLEILEKNWGKKYGMVIDSWERNWDHLSGYFKYPEGIRKMIYTTNAIEGLHRQIRKFTKSKAAFTSETALFKSLYCAIKVAEKKWTQPIPNWVNIISQLHIFFGDRVKTELK